MAINPAQELVWSGRIHLGDQPGVYGNALYAGLTAELPVKLTPIGASETLDFSLTLNAEDLETYSGYPGHSVTVVIFEADPNTLYHAIEREVATGVFTGSDNNVKELSVSIPANGAPAFLSIRLRIDTTVTPGLYDDFVLTKLSFNSPSQTAYASFGF